MPYETFLDDVAATVVKMIKTGRDEPEYVSQRKAFAMLAEPMSSVGEDKVRCILAKDPARLSIVHVNYDICKVHSRIISKNDMEGFINKI